MGFYASHLINRETILFTLLAKLSFNSPRIFYTHAKSLLGIQTLPARALKKRGLSYAENTPLDVNASHIRRPVPACFRPLRVPPCDAFGFDGR